MGLSSFWNAFKHPLQSEKRCKRAIKLRGLRTTLRQANEWKNNKNLKIKKSRSGKKFKIQDTITAIVFYENIKKFFENVLLTKTKWKIM